MNFSTINFTTMIFWIVGYFKPGKSAFIFRICSSLTPKIEIYLKYFFDQFFQKQLLCSLARIQVYGTCCSAQKTHKLV